MLASLYSAPKVATAWCVVVSSLLAAGESMMLHAAILLTQESVLLAVMTWVRQASETKDPRPNMGSQIKISDQHAGQGGLQ